MYLQYYQLKKNPFHLTPDPEFFFPSAGHQAALEAMSRGVEDGKGMVVVTGEHGLGKTLSGRVLLGQYSDARKTVTLSIADPTRLSFEKLLLRILQDFGIQARTGDQDTLLSHVQQELLKERVLSRKVVLIIDDAHCLPLQTLHSLPRLEGLEKVTGKLLHIVLLGLPTLYQRAEPLLSAPDVATVSLTPLTDAESLAYVQHRLARASDAAQPLFTFDALQAIAARAQGVPSRLNTLCHNLLIAGHLRQKHPIAAADIGVLAPEETPKAPRPVWQSPMLMLSSALGIGAIVVCLIWLASPAIRVLPTVESAVSQRLVVADAARVPEGILPTSPPVPAPQAVDDMPGVQAVIVAAPHPETPSEVSALEPAPHRLPLVRTIQPGDTVWDLLIAVYGYRDASLLQQVVAANPQIADIDHIPVGDQLRFPLPTTPGEARRATAPLPSARSARRRPVTLSPKTVVVQSRSPTPVATQQPLSSPWTDVPLMEDTGGSM